MLGLPLMETSGTEPTSCTSLASSGAGLRMISMAPTLVARTKGKLSLDAPVAPVMMKSLKVFVEIPCQAPLAVPPQSAVQVGEVGKPPDQLPAGSAAQFAAGPAAGAAGQALAALGT